MKPEYIIVHHSLTKDSGTVSWGAIRKYHMGRGYIDIGYQFGIELVNDQIEILAGRMPDQWGAHTLGGYNTKSIGICLIGNFDEAPPPKEQMAKLVELTRYLMRAYGISKVNVLGHREADPSRTCPGKLFDMDAFRKSL